MLLTVDIGNTNISFRVFRGDDIIRTFSISSDTKKTKDEYGSLISDLIKKSDIPLSITACAISNVVLALDETIKSAISEYLKVEVFNITHKIKLPFGIKIDFPHELGADRIANAAYAVKHCKLPVIVVDFGTATTFDIVDANKNFVGGMIAPGVNIQAQSLTKFTSKLPKLRIETAKNVIAKNTVDAMLAGVVRGHSCMIDGMVALSEKELGESATFIACGGYSEILYDKVTRKFDLIDKDLTHKGIKILWELNNEKY
ncbi:type III pantothenate kinase [bacterium]|nr:type III pantothenate kinase [bacterium]